MKIWLANPRGFCAGVDRAIDIVNQALNIFDAPVYVRHEVVHNQYVVDNLKKRGAVFVEEIDQVPDGSILIFSAHGVSRSVEEEANARNLKVFDASCPLVKKVHFEVIQYAKNAMECILIGHHGHPEVEGTMGQFDGSKGGAIYLVETLEDVEKLQVSNSNNLGYVTQTTLSIDDTAIIVDALRKKFPLIREPRKNDICYATQNRQDAVRQLTNKCDVILVVGSVNSSNSNRLKELAERSGCESWLIDDADDINAQWLIGKLNVGITAGASAPDVLVQGVIKRLEKSFNAEPPEELLGQQENIVFSIPKELQLKNII